MASEIEVAIDKLSAIQETFGLGPVEIGSPASLDFIYEIEKKLGVKFHDDYREFLGMFGAVSIGDVHFFGSWSNSISDDRYESVLNQTEELRKNYSLPHDLIPVFGSFYQSFLCLNCSSSESEHKLVYYDTEEKAVFSCETAKTFSEFFLNYVHSTIRAFEKSRK